MLSAVGTPFVPTTMYEQWAALNSQDLLENTLDRLERVRAEMAAYSPIRGYEPRGKEDGPTDIIGESDRRTQQIMEKAKHELEEAVTKENHPFRSLSMKMPPVDFIEIFLIDIAFYLNKEDLLQLQLVSKDSYLISKNFWTERRVSVELKENIYVFSLGLWGAHKRALVEAHMAAWGCL